MTRTHRDSSLRFAATFEITTGVFCLLVPRTLVHLLIGADGSGATSVVARIAGLALVALGAACWPPREPSTTSSRPLGAITTYSLLVAAFLACLGARREFVGVLLWPVIIFHAAMTGVLGRKLWRRRPARGH